MGFCSWDTDMGTAAPKHITWQGPLNNICRGELSNSHWAEMSHTGAYWKAGQRTSCVSTTKGKLWITNTLQETCTSLQGCGKHSHTEPSTLCMNGIGLSAHPRTWAKVGLCGKYMHVTCLPCIHSIYVAPVLDTYLVLCMAVLHMGLGACVCQVNAQPLSCISRLHSSPSTESFKS